MRKWCHEIGVVLARRRAAMVRATLPGPIGWAAHLAGRCDRMRPTEEVRLGPLEESLVQGDLALHARCEWSRILVDAGIAAEEDWVPGHQADGEMGEVA